MRHLCILLLMICVPFGYVHAGNKHADNAEEPGMKKVIIRLKDQLDATNYSKSMVGYKGIARRNMFIGKLKSHSTRSQENLLESFQGLKNVKRFWIANIISAEATDEMIEQLRKRSDVESVSIDKKQQTIEEDMDGFTRESTTFGPVSYNVEMVRALEANSYGYTGSGVVVGIIDSGVNTEHEDIKHALWEDPITHEHGWNTILNNNKIQDVTGHGTHCAGIIVGNGKSGTRTGIAPDAKIMIIRNFDDEGQLTNTSDGYEAIQYAAEQGVNLISFSQGYYDDPDSKLYKTWRDIVTNLLDCNIMLVCSGGNRGKEPGRFPIPTNIRMPAACPSPWTHPEQILKGGNSGAFAVGSLVETGDERPESCSMGPVTWQNVEGYNDYPYNPGMGLIKPDVSAPGENVPSLDWKDTKGYKKMSGTSMAAPCVAGIASLILSKNPELTPKDMARIISESSVRIAPNFNCKTGAGRADALLATLYAPNLGMNCTAITIDKTKGLKNGRLNKGDEANLSFTFTNETDEDINDFQLEIKCLSSRAELSAVNNSFSEIKANAKTELSSLCTIKIVPDAYMNELIDIAVIVRKGDRVWTNLFRLPVCKARLTADKMQMKELTGNSNGLFDAGEKAELTFPVISSGNETCLDVTAKLISNSPYISIPENGNTVKFTEISGTENIKFECSAAKDTPKWWYTNDLTLKFTGTNIDTTLTYRLTVGKEAILIVDKTQTHKSVEAVDSYLAESVYSYEKTERLYAIDSLRQFHSIWLFNGIYPKAASITEKEKQTLIDYINEGGYLYMEGGDSWYKDQAGMNEYFKVEPVGGDGGRLKNIVGCMNGFNTEYKIPFTLQNIAIDNIKPIEPAFAFYKNDAPEFITTVAYDQGGYRTIGSSFELGGIVLGTDENKILDSYLDFFLIKDGYFTTGIDNIKQTNNLYVNCYKSGSDYMLEITTQSPSTATINIYSMDGRLMKQIQRNVVEKETVHVSGDDYMGINYITVSTPEGTVARKIIF